MGFIFTALISLIIGALLNELYHSRTKIHGIIEVDHHTEQCKVCITSAELSNRNTKTVTFVVNHDARISRDEQSL